MSIPPLRWAVRDRAPSNVLARYGFDSTANKVLAQVLYNRGKTDSLEAEKFLYNKHLNSPFSTRMRGIAEAVLRVKQAIQKREKIIVYGDFDADGVTSTALVMQALQAFGAQVEPYIPHRVDEGYGLNSEALHKLRVDGAQVVITVDCGIRSVREVEDGLSYGLDLIITDHHSIGPELPQIPRGRGAVINPKQPDCDFPEDMLAGVGVAYELAWALALAYHPKTSAKSVDHQNALKRRAIMEPLLDLVAIGTVADLAPLNSMENRALVRRGLEQINAHPRPGIAALMEVAGVKPGTVTAMTIGFALGPRINAAGRLASAMLAYELLMCPEIERARGLAAELQTLNVQRQGLTRAAQDAIREQIAGADPDSPLIFASGDFQPGIVGLVAGRLVEEFYKPAVVMEQGEAESRASCRSILQFDITGALDQCADLLVRHGGHAQAAGFTVVNANIDPLREKLTRIARRSLADADLSRVLDIDAVIDVRQIDEGLYDVLRLLEPTGHGNPAPVFASYNVRVAEARTVGKEGQHLKLRLHQPGGAVLDCIAFNRGDLVGDLPAAVDVAYQLEMNEWNGSRSLQLNLLDIRAGGTGEVP